jgi:hypothetical protein
VTKQPEIKSERNRATKSSFQDQQYSKPMLYLDDRKLFFKKKKKRHPAHLSGGSISPCENPLGRRPPASPCDNLLGRQPSDTPKRQPRSAQASSFTGDLSFACVLASSSSSFFFFFFFFSKQRHFLGHFLN